MGFLSDFLSNFLATILAGLILGYFLERYFNKKLALEEKNIKEFETAIEKKSKTIQYLELLRAKILSVFDDTEKYLGESLKPSPDSNFYQITTDLWDVLINSGELPNLIEPHLLGLLADFFSIAKEINRLVGNPIPTRDKENIRLYYFVLAGKLKKLLKLKTKSNLINLIDTELINAQKKYELLELIIQKMEKDNSKPF